MSEPKCKPGYNYSNPYYRQRLNDLINKASKAHPDLTITKDFPVRSTPLWKLAEGTWPTKRGLVYFDNIIKGGE